MAGIKTGYVDFAVVNVSGAHSQVTARSPELPTLQDLCPRLSCHVGSENVGGHQPQKSLTTGWTRTQNAISDAKKYDLPTYF